MNTNLKDSEIVLLKLAANSLFNAQLDISEIEIDWKSVFEESKNQAICALAFNSLNDLQLPEEIKEEWFNYAVHFFSKNVEINSYHDYVHSIMTANKIPYCIIKGCASEYYYPKPALRAMGDVDFLVGRQDLNRTVNCFKEKGFNVEGLNHDYHIHLKKGNMDFELHFAIPGIPENDSGDDLQAMLKDIIDKSSLAAVENASFNLPHPIHNAAVMLLHIYSHLTGEGIGLRHLCDWAVFANSFNNEEFISIFEEPFKKIGFWKFARILSATCCKYLKMPYKSWIGEIDESVCEALILDIFEGGNFGAKGNERAWQSQMIGYRGNVEPDKSNLRQLIKVKNKDASVKFPVFAKNKLLYSVGWVFLGFRYGINLICGKRPYVSINEIAKGAEQRKKIYKQFAMFKKE